LETRTVSFPRPWVIAKFLVAAVALVIAGISARLAAPMIDTVVPPEITNAIGTAMMAATTLPLMAMLAYIAWGRRYQRRFRAGWFPLPRRRWALRTRPPTQGNDLGRAESVDDFAPSGAKRTSPNPGDYPLDRGSFKLGALLPVGALAPASGSASGTSETGDRHAPAPLLRRIGPVIGTDALGQMVRLAARDLWAGIAVFGKPRSGKSYLLRSLFAFLMMDQQPMPRDEAETAEQSTSMLGTKGAIIAFESKSGTDAAEYQAWARTLGPKKVHVFDLADPDVARIDMFSAGTTVTDRAAKFVDTMIYLWGDGSIGAASAKTLRGVFTTALGVPATVLADAIATH